VGTESDGEPGDPKATAAAQSVAPAAPAPRISGLRPPFDDIVAGLTVALVLIPQAVAYASLAGLPPSAGLMAAMFPPLAAALLGSSPVLQTGPTALTSLLTLGVLAAAFAPGTPEFVKAAALLALMVGLIRIVVSLLRFGSLAYFMSLPILRGFTSGAAVLIVASQVPAVLGANGQGLGVWRALWQALREPSAWSLPAIGLALAAFVLVRSTRRVSPLVPGALVAVLIGLGATHLLGWQLPTVGSMPLFIPLPTLDLPWEQAGRLALGAAVIAIIGFAEPAAIARAFAERGKPWNPDRELLGQGAANLASGLMSGLPVGGSFSRSAVNRLAGARTRLSGAVAGLAVLAFFPFARLLEGLPQAVLAGIVIAAAGSLLQLGPLLKLWRYAKLQATNALITFALTLALAPRIDYAVVMGISLALFTHLYREAQLGVRILTEEGTLRVELEGVLWFGSMQALERVIQRIEQDLGSVTTVILDTSRLGRIDFSALMLLNETEQRLEERGLQVEVEGLKGRGEMVMGRIRRG